MYPRGRLYTIDIGFFDRIGVTLMMFCCEIPADTSTEYSFPAKAGEKAFDLSFVKTLQRRNAPAST